MSNYREIFKSIAAWLVFCVGALAIVGYNGVEEWKILSSRGWQEYLNAVSTISMRMIIVFGILTAVLEGMTMLIAEAFSRKIEERGIAKGVAKGVAKERGEMEARLVAAVEAGSITQEEADRVRKQMFPHTEQD